MTEIIQPIVGRSIASVQSGGLDDGYQELVIAIIKQAEKDYEGVLLRLFSRPDRKSTRLNSSHVD